MSHVLIRSPKDDGVGLFKRGVQGEYHLTASMLNAVDTVPPVANDATWNCGGLRSVTRSPSTGPLAQFTQTMTAPVALAEI